MVLMLSNSERPRGRGAGDINPENRDGSDLALPRAYALWPLGAGYSVRNFWRAPVSLLLGALGGSRDPARPPFAVDNRAAFSLANEPAKESLPGYLELPHLRGRYFPGDVFRPKGGKR
jgi:hypothetical protein